MADRPEVANLVAALRGRGWSQRRIARELCVSRNTVRSVLERLTRQREEGRSALPAPARRRPSRLDAHEPFLRQYLKEFPDVSAVRVHQELRGRGFDGSYTIVKDHVRGMRPRPKVEPKRRMEVEPGEQGQQDWSPYEIPFTAAGLQVVHAFSLVLSWSRRQYLDFGEREDLYTLLRGHRAAFEYWQGVPREVLYDGQKAVLLGWECGRPLYNPRFLAFATHYGFRPRALPPRKPEWKGRVERQFQYVEGNCLAGRHFRDLAELRVHARWWMENIVDRHVHDRTGETPLERFARERPCLLPLPARPYDTAEVGYRVVSSGGFVEWETTSYSVPYANVLDLVVVRATEAEVLVYGADLTEIARHGRRPRGEGGEVVEPSHHPPKKPRRSVEALVARLSDLGDEAASFAAGVVARQRTRGEHLAAVLALQERYALDDLVRALERACRYRAFDARVVARILEATATPRVLPDTLGEAARQRLRQELSPNAVAPRDLGAYAAALAGRDDGSP